MRSPDGASPDWGCAHLIAAYYLLIYLPRKDERLSWPGWLTYSGRFTHISGHPCRAHDRESSPVKDRRSTNCATQPTKQSNVINHCYFKNQGFPLDSHWEFQFSNFEKVQNLRKMSPHYQKAGYGHVVCATYLLDHWSCYAPGHARHRAYPTSVHQCHELFCGSMYHWSLPLDQWTSGPFSPTWTRPSTPSVTCWKPNVSTLDIQFLSWCSQLTNTFCRFLDISTMILVTR